ncbi:DUF2752 domain-containing protein [bacterium 1XD21-13]|nr:DUF2752 domain-containing protein [bacterium 1XD21-13]
MIDRRRLGKVGLAALLFAGYYEFVRHTGAGIPCLFRCVFRLRCPGCGITHMLMAMGRGDFRGAFHSHPVIFCFGPFLGWILIKCLGNYLCSRKTIWKKWESSGMLVFLIALILFGILRNIL